LIERAYTEGQRRGLEVWGEDEAGPFQTMPYPGASWAPEGHPVRQPHEYQRDGTAKLLTLFHPRDGHVGVKGVTSSANVILHPWLKAELSAILAMLPDLPDDRISAANRAEWLVWQEGLTHPITLPAELWRFSHGIMPLYTPLGGSWLNMTESVQRILKRRALEGQYPKTADEIITWLEATARGWNRAPTPFVWGGKRALRRARWRVRGHVAGGSGACARQPIRRRRCSMSGSQPSNCRPSPHAGSFTNNEQWQYTS
jgi:transposase